jgi:hypothetical protein
MRFKRSSFSGTLKRNKQKDEIQREQPTQDAHVLPASKQADNRGGGDNRSHVVPVASKGTHGVHQRIKRA